MLALMHISTVPVARKSAIAITPKAPPAWRRFVDALLLALASPAV
jgi:hypothetical protein